MSHIKIRGEVNFAQRTIYVYTFNSIRVSGIRIYYKIRLILSQKYKKFYVLQFDVVQRYDRQSIELTLTVQWNWVSSIK